MHYPKTHYFQYIWPIFLQVISNFQNGTYVRVSISICKLFRLFCILATWNIKTIQLLVNIIIITQLFQNNKNQHPEHYPIHLHFTQFQISAIFPTLQYLFHTLRFSLNPTTLATPFFSSFRNNFIVMKFKYHKTLYTRVHAWSDATRLITSKRLSYTNAEKFPNNLRPIFSNTLETLVTRARLYTRTKKKKKGGRKLAIY